MRRGFGRAAMQVSGDRGQDGVVDQGGFARARYAGHAGKQTDRKRHVDPAQIVAACAAHDQLTVRVRGASLLGRGDAQRSCQIASGERCRVLGHFLGRALGDDLTAVHARAGAKVDHVVAGPDGVFVVFDHEYRVTEIAQVAQGLDEPFIVALMQADRGFIEDVHDASEARADLASQPDALTLAARERFGRAIERQVVEADVDQKTQSGSDLTQDPFAHRRPRARQDQGLEPGECPAQGPVRKFGDGFVGHAHETRLGTQSRAFALGADFDMAILAQLLADRCRVGLFPASIQIGQDAFERMHTHRRFGAVAQVGEWDFGAPRTLENDLSNLRRQRFPGCVDFEPVERCQALQHLEEKRVPAVPAPDGSARQAQLRELNDAARIEVGHVPQTVTAGAGPGWIVE